MSAARFAAILETLRMALDATDQLDPVERDQVYRVLVADLRSRRPESVSPLSLGPPTDPIRDPRGGGPMTAARAFLDAALSYTEQSPQWPIFPVDPTTKRPLIKTGDDHAEHASTDPEQIKHWIRRWPHCGIGMPTGAASGAVVIDADRKHDGEAMLADLECLLGPLPRVREARTRSGGLHVYLAHPGGIRVRTSQGAKSPLGKLLGGRNGIDVRADGGIVVLPPSFGYQWISDDDEPLPPMPPMWLAAIQGAGDPPPPPPAPRPEIMPDATDRMRRARAYLAKIPGAVEYQAGHTSTFDAVCAVMIGFDLDEHEAWDLFANDYNPRCDPPWSERELRHKISSASKHCKRERGYLLAARSTP